MAKLKYIQDFNEQAHHMNDVYKNLGYDYNKALLKNVVSSEMFGNPLNDIPMREIEILIQTLINEVKRIKLQYAIAFPKNSKLIN